MVLQLIFPRPLFEKPEDALDFYRDSGPDEYVVKPIQLPG
jgi:hypothetical protein